MKKVLSMVNENSIYHYENGNIIVGSHKNITGDVSNISGDVSSIYGNASGVTGDVSNISGNASGITGNVSNITGNLDDAEITSEDRSKGVHIQELLNTD